MNPENEEEMIRHEWAAVRNACSTQDIPAGVERISRVSIHDCLNYNIKTNNGALILSRDFIRGIVESTIIKNNLKFVLFTECVEKICDQLICSDLEVSYPACTLDLNIISKNIQKAIINQAQIENPIDYVDHNDGTLSEYKSNSWKKYQYSNKKVR
jgi:hypothetical protein